MPQADRSLSAFLTCCEAVLGPFVVPCTHLDGSLCLAKHFMVVMRKLAELDVASSVSLQPSCREHKPCVLQKRGASL